MLHGTHFDQRDCHKWALLLNQRRQKLDALLSGLESKDVSDKMRLFQEIFYGVPSGKEAEPGMAGSLLYHMAMVTKMETETQVLLKELDVDVPDVTRQLLRFYEDFISDASELAVRVPANLIAKEALGPSPTSNEKIALFMSLNQKTKALASRVEVGDRNVRADLEALFQEWSNRVAEMRFRQEYHTIRGLLILSELSKTFGVSKLGAVMQKVQDKFGRETVNIALDVTLKVGMRREKLQSIMLSDHYINYTMSVDTLDGHMQFLNCPIYGGHKYIGEKLGISKEVTSLFCTHFCFAHAKAMLETVLPFTFDLTQPQIMATDGKCQYYMRLGASPTRQNCREIYSARCFLESDSKM